LLKLEFWFAGVDKLDARSFVRNLTRRGVATSFMKDMGRQRVTCFVARRFTNNSKTNNEIEREMKKQEGLVTHFFNFCFFFGFLPFFGGGGSDSTTSASPPPQPPLSNYSFLVRHLVDQDVMRFLARGNGL
jgi:hypothetical protein